MHNTYIYIAFYISIFFSSGCTISTKSSTQDCGVISIDTKSDYPKIELTLQNFMNVEYIPLESSDEFVCQGQILDIGKEYIIVKNYLQDGNIFIFNRNGKGIRKINRLGSGGEDYTYVMSAMLDEENNELFINDPFIKKVIVYDLSGKFKRSFPHQEQGIPDEIFNFNDKSFVCQINYFGTSAPQAEFAVISKHDGQIIDKIIIDYKAHKSTEIANSFDRIIFSPIIPKQKEWILTDASSDTIYTTSLGGKTPFMYRTPSIQSMSTEIFVFPKVLTNRYAFVERVKKENQFTTTHLVHDNNKSTWSEYTLYNEDYVNSRPINLFAWRTKNDQIGYWHKLDASQLLDALAKEELTGKLKNIAATLNEDSNPVIMLATDKQIK